jgi:hypothetical protein
MGPLEKICRAVLHESWGSLEYDEDETEELKDRRLGD